MKRSSKALVIAISAAVFVLFLIIGLVAGDGEAITCEDNDGWRWEPS